MALTTVKAIRPTALLIYYWHEYLSHLHEEVIKRLTNLADRIKIDPNNFDVSVCQLCLQGKQHQTFNHIPSTRVTQQLELVHSDLCSLFPTPSIIGSKYFIL